MRDTACDTGVIIADAVALAELPGGTGHERVRIDWLWRATYQAALDRQEAALTELATAVSPGLRLEAVLD